MGGHTQSTALTNVNTVIVSPWSAGIWLYKGLLTSPRNFSSLGTFYTPVHHLTIGCSLQFFFNFFSNSENEDGDDVDPHDIFTDPAVKEQLLQNDLEHERELEQQDGTTLTVTADVHTPVIPKTEHVDVVSKDKYLLQ